MPSFTFSNAVQLTALEFLAGQLWSPGLMFDTTDILHFSALKVFVLFCFINFFQCPPSYFNQSSVFYDDIILWLSSKQLWISVSHIRELFDKHLFWDLDTFDSNYKCRSCKNNTLLHVCLIPMSRLTDRVGGGRPTSRCGNASPERHDSTFVTSTITSCLFYFSSANPTVKQQEALNPHKTNSDVLILSFVMLLWSRESSRY